MSTRLTSRRREVVRAAAVTFAAHGFRTTTMLQLASAAGISRPALYLHYPTKVDLYLAAADEAAVVAEEAVLRQVRRPGASLAQRVSAAALAWLDSDVDRWVTRDGPDLPRGVRADLETVVARHRRSLEHALAGCTGELGDGPARAGVAHAALALAVGARALSSSHEEREWRVGQGVTLLCG